MENVVLTILLIFAVLLIGVVLIQRSEGGGLGMGGGSNVMTGRQAANALTKATWILGIGFMAAALAMTIIAAKNAAGVSVVDRITESPAPAAPVTPAAPTSGNLLPPAASDAPLTPPPAVDATSPAAPEAAATTPAPATLAPAPVEAPVTPAAPSPAPSN